MSFVDLDSLSPSALIAQYVLECRGQGHALPYSDYHVIEEWLDAAGDADELLLVLSETLPEHYEADRCSGRKPRPLAAMRKRILQRLRERAFSTGRDES